MLDATVSLLPWWPQLNACNTSFTVGTDVRKLIVDGYPSSNVYACDLHDGFIKLRYKLFGDESLCQINFFQAHIFSILPYPANGLTSCTDSPTISLKGFLGRVTHLYAGLFFHLFDEPMELQIARIFARLLCRAPGSLIFGTHIGRILAGEFSTLFSKWVMIAVWVWSNIRLTNAKATLGPFSRHISSHVEDCFHWVGREGVHRETSEDWRLCAYAGKGIQRQWNYSVSWLECCDWLGRIVKIDSTDTLLNLCWLEVGFVNQWCGFKCSW